ncbi:zinc-ribbon domain-containing protein [Clostridium senegalense]|uniref:zinc-ribbon domain-containing protein n=1 Tax=Clostridium senegalense TaxID=1465809 RepID=UPI0002886770|nr:zinc-ribbon domain-containing protein [Clostridium senegalense]MBU5227520.1 zinc ribbon domain-containing protein [Clostridium senegalense]
MFCKNCGKQINNNAEICIHCGVRVAPSRPRSVDNPSHLAGIVSCCFPIVGLILYFLWKDDKPKSSKLVCNWMLAGIIVWVTIYLVCFILSFTI